MARDNGAGRCTNQADTPLVPDKGTDLGVKLYTDSSLGSTIVFDDDMRIADLAGSRAEGSLQIGQVSINQLLALNSTGTKPVVELLAHNQLVLRYGMIQARAEIVPTSDRPASPPSVRLRLASTLVA